METSHTPGPWKVLTISGDPFVAAEPYDGHPYFGVSRTIQILSDEDYPTKKGDARLIASAPDLFTALEVDALVDQYEDPWNPDRPATLKRLLELGFEEGISRGETAPEFAARIKRTAIARATGKEN